MSKPSTNDGNARLLTRELRRAWDKIIDDYPNTPWAVLARRERLTGLGLEWRPARE